MLELKNITKNYAVGTGEVKALRGIDTVFRKSEFVSILGPSGCGKTTLLNIIGGLDGYTDGDLVIGGRSTKDFRDGDWDAYRNHSIGFVFQSYNLIPHQSVLANVELSLTISGISRGARRARAREALCRVGLESEMNKKPSQMSGGQMQRVAIARALVNDPEILLADEPTGALDSETSVQIMELLREVAKDRLVIMVTHNPALAEQYSTRILRMLDGKITDDTNPCTAEEAASLLPKKEETAEKGKKKQKRLKNKSMSFLTALSLSLNNLRTKKGRTFLTGFAGSIGIIGIALILAVSQGVNSYIAHVQEDTLTGFPIILQRETVDMGSLVTTMMSANKDSEGLSHERDAVYANRVMYDLLNSLSKVDVQRNNLTAFKAHLESTDAYDEFVSAVRYVYDVKLPIYIQDKEGHIVSADPAKLMQEIMPQQGGPSAFASYKVWEEMLAGENGEIVSDLIPMQYDVIYGELPKAYNEIVLVVDAKNEVSDLALYTLGLKTTEEVKKELTDAITGKLEEGKTEKYTYEELCNMEFKLILPSELYRRNADGTYTDISDNEAGLSLIYASDTPVTLRISGILRPSEDASSPMLTGAIGYTSALTDYAIAESAKSELIEKQLADPTTDVLTGLLFRGDTEDVLSDGEKAARIKEYFAGLSVAEKAAIYTAVQSVMPEDAANAAAMQVMSSMTPEQLIDMAVAGYAEKMGVTDTEEIRRFIENMKEEERNAMLLGAIREKVVADYAARTAAALGAMTSENLASLFDAKEFTTAEYVALFDTYMPSVYSDSTYEEVLKRLGYVDVNDPTAIQLYASSFKNKDGIAELIESYNDGASEADKISYTDYVKILLSSITVIISAISYVLIAFVAISLVVSSIMIGIITYISVLERTKEIGILRAIGASKRDISRVFNAETAIVGFLAGLLGIGVTLLIILLVNPILHALTGIPTLNAVLPVNAAVILVAISVILTLVAGIIPAGMAAKKDPVIALRTE